MTAGSGHAGGDMVYVKLTGPGTRDPGGCSEGLVPLSCIRGTRAGGGGGRHDHESGRKLVSLL